MENYQNQRQDIRIEKLEKQRDELWNCVNNHITTTEKRLSKVETNMDWLMWQSRVTIAGVIGIILKLFLG
jgi:hypothetical protein